MKSFKSVIIVLVVATVLISGIIGVLAYTTQTKTKQKLAEKQEKEESSKIKANSVAELFAAEDIVIDYEKAPDDMKKLMKIGSSFHYNGDEYKCTDGHTFYRKAHAFRIISKEDAEKILNYVDLDSCSYYEAECICDILSEVMGYSTIGTAFPYQNSNYGICARIIAGEERVLIVVMRTGVSKPAVVLKSITYSQAKEENLLFPEPGEYKNEFEDEKYGDTLAKILKLCNFPKYVSSEDN